MELSSVWSYVCPRYCLEPLLNTKQTKPHHTLFGFAPHPKQTRVCQSALERDAVDLTGHQHTLHTLVPQICVANAVGDMLS